MSKKLLAFLFIIVAFVSCVPEEETDAFWNDISVSSRTEPFIFVFSNTDIPTCADHALPKLNEILNGEIEGIEESTVNGVMMYPSTQDDQYSNIAEELKFLFDQSGNNTFTSYPAFFDNLTCFNLDTPSWHTSIKNQLDVSPKVKLGLKSNESDGNLKVYVKGVYSTSVTNHSLAVYAYRKSNSAIQKTTGGTQSINITNKVVSSLTPTVGKSLGNGSNGGEIRQVLTLSLDGENLSNLGVVAVIYGLEDGKPVSVINSVNHENL